MMITNQIDLCNEKAPAVAEPTLATRQQKGNRRCTIRDDADYMQLPPLLSVEALERVLHLDRKTISRMCRADLLPQPIHILGRSHWRRQDIEQLLAPSV